MSSRSRLWSLLLRATIGMEIDSSQSTRIRNLVALVWGLLERSRLGLYSLRSRHPFLMFPHLLQSAVCSTTGPRFLDLSADRRRSVDEESLASSSCAGWGRVP